MYTVFDSRHHNGETMTFEYAIEAVYKIWMRTYNTSLDLIQKEVNLALERNYNLFFEGGKVSFYKDYTKRFINVNSEYEEMTQKEEGLFDDWEIINLKC